MAPTGTGLMIAKALAHNKAKRVYIIGRRREKLEDAIRQIDRPEVVIAMVGDITNQDDLKNMATQVKQKEGHVNLLVPNAGIMGPKIRELSADCSVEEFVELA
jgi:NADP-dependent 3-hydroxy acid dehydrogenase YdfG